MISQYLSEKISFFSFLLMILVVILHSTNITTVDEYTKLLELITDHNYLIIQL